MTKNLSDEFSLREDILYLNHAAVAPWPRRTVEAVKEFAEENGAQGSKAYLQWLAVESNLRTQLQQLINAPSSDDIALLKNTSEALSVVAFGLPWQTGDNIVTSNEEFPSNRVVWEALREQGVELRQADLHGADTPEDALFARVDARTRLMSVSSIQYASGLRLDLEKLGRFCRKHGILFCIDAIQSIGAVRFDVQAAQADFVMADGHKWMLGPEGLALFYCRAELRDQLRLNQYGWHMTDSFTNFDRNTWAPAPSARRFECGSPNMLGIHALSASVSLLLETGMERVEAAVIDNARTLHDAIAASPNLELLSDTTPGRFGGIVTFRHRTLDNQRLFDHLTQNGVMCALRGGGVRFSPHFYTPREQLLRAVELADQAG
jgi:selenocysteine lyase/cysteine desulfurase